MQPYYEDDHCVIYHGDCRDVLPSIGQVGLVLSDPPYCEQVHNGARTRTEGARSEQLVSFDSIPVDDLRVILSSCVQHEPRWMVMTMAWDHAAALSLDPPIGVRFIRLGCWVKPNGAPQLSGDRPAQGWEAVAILHNEKQGRMRWNGGGTRAAWQDNTVNAVDHPTQKPLSLYRRWVALFSEPGEAVLDPFMGSGTSLRAAKDLGRKAIGIEIDERYCEIAVKRLGQEAFDFSDVI